MEAVVFHFANCYILEIFVSWLVFFELYKLNFLFLGLYRQHNGKKLKIVKPSFDNNLDNASLMTNSIPSLAASQMSYMSNLSKSFKTAKGRNAKTFKVTLMLTSIVIF